MDNIANNSKLIVLIDNDFVIRDVLRKLIRHKFSRLINILTSENGVEGVGYIFISKPDVIILDTTLPKYGGLELIEYLQSNQGLRERNTPVILVHQSKNIPLTNYVNTIKLNKDDNDFLNKLVNAIDFALNTKDNANINIIHRLIRHFGINAIRQSNRSTLLIDLIRDIKKPKISIPIFSDLVFSLEWLFNQVLLSINLTFFTILSGKQSVEESNIKQSNKDLAKFRVRYYPTLAGIFATFLIILLQLVFFVIGGVVIFGTRIDLSSALTGSEEGVDFVNASFDANEIELLNGNFKLREIVTTTPLEQDTILEEVLPLSSPEILSLQQRENIISSEVLGYSILNPEIIFNTPVQYSVLRNIYEESSVNNRESSIFNLLRSDIDVSETNITYQLSPNKLDWYYFEYSNLNEIDNLSDITLRNGVWTTTIMGYQSSNTIREVNYFLQSFVENVGKSTKELYIKAFLHSNGNVQTSLNNLIVERDVYLSTNLENVIQEENTNVVSYPENNLNDEVINSNLDKANEVLPSPTIFQATFMNGNKIVLGKLLNTEISDSDFGKYIVRVYYTTSTDISTKALDKIEYIGETGIARNANGDIYFYLETPNREGGYVTSELVYVNNGIELVSELSKPLENSTFTVDSTLDTDDNNLGNGVCLTAGGVCTLRAALSETFTLVDTYATYNHNIYFNISTSDSGYRDYDDPNTASSGDSTGGDDYWTIRPTTQYNLLINSVTIDGSTQESLSGFNRNTSGPDIEIKDGASVSKGFAIFHLASTTGYNEDLTSQNRITIKSLVVNSFNVQVSTAGGGGLLIENSYLCTDPKGGAGISASGVGLLIDGESNTIKNNVIGNCSSSGISGDIEYTKIFGNKIGVNADGTTAITTTSAINATTTVGKGSLIGGSNAGEGNILRGSSYCTNIRFTNVTGSGFIGSLINNTCGLNQAKDAKFSSGPMTVSTLTGGTTITVSGNISSSGFEINGTFGIITNNIAGTNESKAVNLGDTSKNGFKIFQISEISEFSNNAAYYMLNGVYNLSENVVLDDLDLQYNANAGVLIEKFALTSAAFSDTITLKNSVINNNTNYGVSIFSLSPTIKGNEIKNNGKDGILLANSTLAVDRLTANVSNSKARPVIGGQSAYSGSLCNSLEQNCIEGNDNHGIQSVDNIPSNETTLYADNSFGTGNGSSNSVNIVQAWVGGFEIFSGTNRRTDVTSNTLTVGLPASSFVRANYATAVKLDNLNLTNANSACLSASDCPTTGHTDGVNGQSHFMNGKYGYIVNEYVINNSGVKTDYSTFKIDDNHFSSTTYSFDGNSTTHTINTASSRTINTYNYTDRGEPWVDNPTSTRDIGTGDWGRFQIMEVEYVDANPVLQGDGSYIITVDSSDDNGNGTVTYYNDGVANASGGIIKTVTDGIADGKTSLRESLLISQTFGPLTTSTIYINFNIPKTDSGYRDYDDPNTASSGDNVGGDDYWTIRPVNSLPVMTATSGRTVLDATTQTLNQGDTNVNGPEIEVNGVSSVGAGIRFTKSVEASAVNQVHLIKGIAVNRFSFNLGDSFTSRRGSIEDNYICLDVKGLATTNDYANARNGIGMVYSEFISIKNNLIGDCVGGIYIERLENAMISGNTIGISKDGSSQVPMDSGIYISYFENDSVIGGDNISDRNYLRGDVNCIMVQTSAGSITNSKIKNNYCGLTKDGLNKLSSGNFDVLFGTGSALYEVSNNYSSKLMTLVAENVLNNTIGTDSTRTLNLGNSLNDGISISAYTKVFSGNYVANMKNGLSHSSQSNITEFNNNSFINNQTGVSIDLSVTSSNKNVILTSNLFEDNVLGLSINSNSVNDYVFNVNNNTFRDNTTSSVKILGNSKVKVLENVFETTNTTKAVIDISGGVENSNLVNTNDNGDSDSGVNNLMNYTVIESVKYIGSGTYTVSGTLDNAVNGEGPFDIEICESDGNTNGGGCLNSGIVENVTQNVSGLTSWSGNVTITNATGSENRYFSALATNNIGSTSEFGSNFYTLNHPNYTLQKYDITLTYPVNGTTIDDSTPLFDWNASLDPDLASYQLFVNGNFIASIPEGTTQYQYTNPLNDNVTWKVVGIRGNGSIGGESVTQNFKVLSSIGLELVSPVDNIKIDDTTPLFDWNASNDTNVYKYQIYLNNELLAEVLKVDGSEYQAQTELPLGIYTWKVIALNSDNVLIEETLESTFVIFEEYILNSNISYVERENILTINSQSLKDLLTSLTIKWNISGSDLRTSYKYKIEIFNDLNELILEKYITDLNLREYIFSDDERVMLFKDKEYSIKVSLVNEDSVIISDEYIFIFNIFKEVNFIDSVRNNIDKGFELPENISEILLPIAPLIGAIGLATIASIYVAGGGFFSKMGLLLIGAVIRPKRRRWGIVYDKDEGKPLPFAQVRIYKRRDEN